MQAARQQAKNPAKLPNARYITEISFTASNGRRQTPEMKSMHAQMK